jgi:hypothetical protein
MMPCAARTLCRPIADWLKMKNPACAAVKREADGDAPKVVEEIQAQF